MTKKSPPVRHGVRKGSLRGFATVTMANGMVVHDAPVHVSHGKPWAAPPAKPRLDQDTRQVTLDGKPQWDPAISFRSKVRDKWSRQIIEAMLQVSPDALNDGSAGS